MFKRKSAKQKTDGLNIERWRAGFWFVPRRHGKKSGYQSTRIKIKFLTVRLIRCREYINCLPAKFHQCSLYNNDNFITLPLLSISCSYCSVHSSFTFSYLLFLHRFPVTANENMDKEQQNQHRSPLLSISMVLWLYDIGWTCKTCAISREIACGSHPLRPFGAPTPIRVYVLTTTVFSLTALDGWWTANGTFDRVPWESRPPLALYSNDGNRNSNPGQWDCANFPKFYWCHVAAKIVCLFLFFIRTLLMLRFRNFIRSVLYMEYKLYDFMVFFMKRYELEGSPNSMNFVNYVIA